MTWKERMCTRSCINVSETNFPFHNIKISKIEKQIKFITVHYYYRGEKIKISSRKIQPQGRWDIGWGVWSVGHSATKYSGSQEYYPYSDFHGFVFSIFLHKLIKIITNPHDR